MDPKLQALFTESDVVDEAGTETTASEFASQVMQRIKQQEQKTNVLRLVGITLLVLIGSLFAVPVELANVISYGFTAPIFSIGESWLAWLLTPINNCGALVIVLLKLLRVMTLRSRGTHVNLLPF